MDFLGTRRHDDEFPKQLPPVHHLPKLQVDGLVAEAQLKLPAETAAAQKIQNDTFG